jgi:hypothetical protein
MVETHTDPLSSSCVDAATLAAFIDSRLDAAERGRVIAHLASCPDCSELVGEVIAVSDALAADPAPVVVEPDPVLPPKRLFWNKRRGMAAVGGFMALAASIVLVMLNRGGPLAPLVAIVGDQRLTMARPTGNFRYGPLRSAMRGSRETAELSLRTEAARLRQRATETGAPSDLQAAGIAQLLAGDVADGVTALESAARARPQDAAIHADLGAGYMTRFVETGDEADAVAALAALDRAVGLDPKSHGTSISPFRSSPAGATRRCASGTRCSRKPGRRQPVWCWIPS